MFSVEEPIRERAFSDAKKVSISQTRRNTGSSEYSPPRHTFNSFSPASSPRNIHSPVAFRENTFLETSRARTISRSSYGVNRDFLTVPWNSLESFYDIEDGNNVSTEEVLCLMPTGIVIEINVHPDNVISNIKQTAIGSAMNNGKLAFYLILKDFKLNK